MNRYRLFSLFVSVFVLTACSSTSPNLSQNTSESPTTFAAIRGQQHLQQAIDAVLQSPDMAPTNAGILVQRLSDGQILYEKNSKKLFHPASIMKLLTSAISLHELGPGFVFTTKLAVDSATVLADTLAGDLYIIGDGDPSFSLGDLAQLVAAFQRTGVTAIDGDIICDATIFDDFAMGEGWMWDDAGAWYSAPISGLSINENCIDVYALPGDSAGQPAKVRLEPNTSYFEIVNTSTTIDSAGFQKLLADTSFEMPRFNISRRWETRENVLEVEGMIGEWYAEYDRTIDVVDAARYFGTLFREACQLQGITLTGDVALGKAPKNRRIIAEKISKPLNQLLPDMNKPSSNLYAESFLKRVAAKRFESPGSSEKGIYLLNELLARGQVDTTAIRVADGSGVSRYTLLTPETMLRVLSHMHASPELKHEFIASLPIAGVDGTLERRMRGSAAEKIVHAKTGTLSGVSCLAGYTTNRDGDEIAFAIMMSHFVGSSRPYRDLQDRICEVITLYSEQ